MATWLEDIIGALQDCGGVAHLDQIYSAVSIRRNIQPIGTVPNTIRNAIHSHSNDSVSFKGNHVFYSVEGIGSGVWGLVSNTQETPVAVDSVSLLSAAPSVPTNGYRILRDTKLARDIKILRHHTCQICGISLTLSDRSPYAEAHHIKPLGTPHSGPDHSSNIIILCPNHHALCDYGAIKIDLSLISPIPGHAISQIFVDYHNNIICQQAP